LGDAKNSAGKTETKNATTMGLPADECPRHHHQIGVAHTHTLHAATFAE